MIFPYEKLVYITNMAFEPLIATLSQKVILIESSSHNNKEKVFTLRFRTRRNKLSILKTRMILIRHQAKTKAKFIIRFPNLALLFLLIWFGFIGRICYGILKHVFLNQNEFNPAMYIPFILFSVGYILLVLGFKSESRKLKKLLQETTEQDDII